MIRNKHSLSHYKLATFNMGELIPIGLVDVLPGDSFRVTTSALIRALPLEAPVMHPVNVRIHHWYIPLRLLWDQFEQFITGGEDGEGDGAVYPTYGTAGYAVGSLADYLGVPTGVAIAAHSALPFNAYNLVYNENYRDQDLVPEVALSSGNIQRVAWEKDYFTTARPWPQKGPDVTIPIGGVIPVVGEAGEGPTFDAGAGVANENLASAAGSANVQWSGGAAGGAGTAIWNDPNLEADLSALGIPVTDLRLALSLQRLQEARAQFGSRYTEYLRYYGVRSSDARLQRPEYLGGGRATISFSEVLNTGGQDDGADVPTGTMVGHGIAALRTRPFVRFFEEHGYLLSLASIRPRSMYATGLHRSWSRTTKEAFWTRELEHVGQQEVLNQEVYAAAASPGATFGYADRYSEYRHQPSQIAGRFRESAMNFWHMARLFGAAPSLNASFITCDPGLRNFADQAAGAHNILGMFSHSIQARRMVGHRTVGRVF